MGTSRIQPGQAAHPPENACKYRLKARASKLVKHGVLHYGDALPHWTARALFQRAVAYLAYLDATATSSMPPHSMI